MPRLSFSEHRQLVISALTAEGGIVSDPAGFVNPILGAATGLSGPQVSKALRDLDTMGVIEREVRGKRTFAVMLVGEHAKPSAAETVALTKARAKTGKTQKAPAPDELAEPEPALEPEPMQVFEGTPTSNPATLTVTPVTLTADQVADALLRRVMEVLEGPELARIDGERLNDTLEENGRLRRKLAAATEEARDIASERDRLRQRVRLLDADKAALQQNLDQALKAHTREVDAEVSSRVARFMQEIPKPNLKAVD